MRSSKRLKKETPDSIDDMIASVLSTNPSSRSLKSALTEGGFSGRSFSNYINEPKWNLNLDMNQESEAVDEAFTIHNTNFNSCSYISNNNNIKKDNNNIKKDNNNYIVDVEALQSSLESNLVCKKCQSSISMKYSSIGLATELLFTCKNNHTFNIYPSTCRTLHKTKKNGSKQIQERASWYAINVQYVMSILSSGNGPRDSSTISSFLGFPSATNFGSSTFSAVEQEIGNYLIKVAEESMEDALEEEVNKTISTYSYYSWK